LDPIKTDVFKDAAAGTTEGLNPVYLSKNSLAA